MGSDQTFLIVILVFAVVNLCLIIATGGIIYNWQDRYMGRVLSCKQPKWTSDGYEFRRAVGIYNEYRTTGRETTHMRGAWNNNNNNDDVIIRSDRTSVNVRNSDMRVSSRDGSVAVSTRGDNWNEEAYRGRYSTAADTTGSPIVSAGYTSYQNNKPSFCPYITFPRWYQAPRPVPVRREPVVVRREPVVVRREPVVVRREPVVVRQPEVRTRSTTVTECLENGQWVVCSGNTVVG